MARMRFFVVVVTLFSVACDAAVSDAQEETCADPAVKQQLMQARATLHAQKKEEDIAKPDEAKDGMKCPWHQAEGKGCHLGSKALCANGEESWSCNFENKGPRLQCPCHLPYMCKDKKCGKDGADYCCEPDCKDFGGLRPCEGEQEEQPVGEPTKPPAEIPPTPAPPPPLKWMGENPKGKLGLCEGDCDKDSGCAGNLKCFQRDGHTTPPGCDGIGKKGYDYCYDPDTLGLPTLNTVGKDPKGSLSACAGDCDSDDNCEKGLVCYQRTGTTDVPGCQGAGKKDYDYCIEPVTQLSDKGIDPKDKIEECLGDCDKDSQCVGSLKCFQRDEFEPVPGCEGPGVEAWDYCYDPAKA